MAKGSRVRVAREFSHGSGACILEVMMQGKGVDPGSPTQAENGQAGMFLGTRQPVPPSTPSSDSQEDRNLRKVQEELKEVM